MDAILRIEHLSKSYKEVKAVQDISFEVKRGSLFAFLGPNGAGKSTTINMITTLLSKDGGEIYFNNQTNPYYFREKIGVVFQNNVLDDLLTVKENLVVRGALYLNNQEEVMKRYNELKEYLDFGAFEHQKFKTLSGGQKRRIEIARALFSNPELLLLDEPTTGLDPETRQVVWKVIDRLRAEKGLTIFLTTHYMEEATNADHVIIINHGKIITQGTPAMLKDKYSYDRMKIVPKDKKKFTEFINNEKIEYVKVADQFIIKVSETDEAFELLAKFRSYTQSFEVIKGTMDDVFINVIGDGIHV